MKARFNIALSMALNVMLAVMAWRPFSESTTSSPDAAPVMASAEAEISQMPAADPAPSAQGPVETPAFHWSSVESSDYREYIANLQAIGCPEKTIRDIVVADIDQLYSARMPPEPTAQPWHSGTRRRAEARHSILTRSALAFERRALVKQLLGYEWDNSADDVWHQDEMTAILLGFLPEEKALKVMSVAANRLERSRAVKEAANYMLIDEDRFALRELFDALTQDVTSLLSSAEREELELRLQAGGFLAAENIHWDGVEATGVELRQFVRLSKTVRDTFADEFLGSRPMPEAEKRTRRAEFERQVALLLGTVRFGHFKRAQDQGFRELLQFAADRGISRDAAVAIYDACLSAEAGVRDATADAALSADERQAAAAALKASAKRFVATRLGNAYTDFLNGPGHWMNILKPTTQTEAQ